MVDPISKKAEAINSEPSAQNEPHCGDVIQCRQCSESFGKSTIVCPRCNRWNDRSVLARVLTVLLSAIILGLIAVTAWGISKAASQVASEPKMDGSLKPLGKGSATSTPEPPDLRF